HCLRCPTECCRSRKRRSVRRTRTRLERICLRNKSSLPRSGAGLRFFVNRTSHRTRGSHRTPTTCPRGVPPEPQARHPTRSTPRKTEVRPSHPRSVEQRSRPHPPRSHPPTPLKRWALGAGGAISRGARGVGVDSRQAYPNVRPPISIVGQG